MDLSASGTPPCDPKSQTGCLLCLGLYSQTVCLDAHRVRLLHIKKTKLDIIFSDLVLDHMELASLI